MIYFFRLFFVQYIQICNVPNHKQMFFAGHPINKCAFIVTVRTVLRIECAGHTKLCGQKASAYWQNNSQKTVAFYENHVFPAVFADGPDGNRTRVQKPIPCPSTSVVYSLTFPPQDLNKHNSCFSSFMIRPHTQSLICVVSCIVEAWLPECRCPGSDCCS